VGFDVTDQLLIRPFAFVRYLRKKGSTSDSNSTIRRLQESYDSVRREALYSILTELAVPMKLLRLIKMCLNETHSKVRIGKYLSDNFLIQNGLK
jgi:hypothetical protein